MGQSDEVRRQFGPVASAYVSSSFHAHGPDLARLVAEAGFTGTEVVLDLGCGAGHTALACANHAARVVGVDVTPEMVGVASCTARADEAELPLGWHHCEAIYVSLAVECTSWSSERMVSEGGA